MTGFLKKYAITAFWLVIVTDCLLLAFNLPYTYIFEPLIVPFLLLNLFLRDQNIGQPAAKFMYYVGLMFSFFGDVLQIVVNNQLFFTASLVAFMLTNICFAVSALSLNLKGVKTQWRLIPATLILVTIGWLFMRMPNQELQDVKVPMIIYMSSLVFLQLACINLYGNTLLKKAFPYYLAGALTLLVQNISFGINLFYNDGAPAGFIFTIFSYGLSQYFFMKAVLRTHF